MQNQLGVESEEEFWNQLINGLEDPDELEEAKTDPSAKAYPNAEGRRNPGHFDYEELTNAESYREFRKWFKPMLFNFIRTKPEKLGPISTHTDEYVTVLQKAHEQHNNNFDIHTWHYTATGLERGGSHGLGQVYDRTNDELFIFESVNTPLAGQDPVPGNEINETAYLDEDAEIYEDGQWHPLRFANFETDPAIQRNAIDFKSARSSAVGYLGNIASVTTETTEPYVGTTSVIQSATDALLNYDSNGFDFDEVYDFAKLQRWCAKNEDNFVIAGEFNDPEVYRIEEGFDELRENIRNDKSGLYDRFDEVASVYNSEEGIDWSEAAEIAN